MMRQFDFYILATFYGDLDHLDVEDEWRVGGDDRRFEWT